MRAKDGTFKEATMLLTEVKPTDERGRLLELAAKLRQQAKDHRQRYETLDAYRLENRARIMETKANETDERRNRF